MDLTFIMVIYNKRLTDTLTFSSIRNWKDVQVVLCDNSTSDQGNERLAHEHGYRYICMQGNQGLAKAYNRALDAIGPGEGVICLLDDDTRLPADYPEKIRQAYARNHAKIWLPLVKDQTGYLSPAIVTGYGWKRIAQPEDVDVPGVLLTGINSGMAVDRRIMQEYRYDERYFLDFIDHAFLRDMRCKNVPMMVLKDVVLHQTFSSDVQSKQAAKERFLHFKEDVKRFYSASPTAKRYGQKILLRRRCKLCLKHKTLTFLFA